MMIRRDQRRVGYTLMEMVVVMAIVVIVTGISIPVMTTMLTDSRIMASGDMIRARLAETRARAMESGRPWKLACLVNSGVYQFAPEDSTAWENTDSTPTETDEIVRDEMPKEIIFGLASSDIFGIQSAPTPGGTWQTIAVYLPDGSARDDSTIFFGHPGIAPMRVQIRGLTGAVSVDDPNSIRMEQS